MSDQDNVAQKGHKQGINDKKRMQKERILKDSFWNLIKYVTCRQEKDEEL